MSINFFNTDNVSITTHPGLAISGAYGVNTVQIADRSFLYAVSLNSNSLVAFEVGADGTLTDIQTLLATDDPNYALFSATQVHVFEIEGKPFLSVAGGSSDRVAVFQINNDGTLELAGSAFDTVSLELDGALTMNTVEIDGTTFLYVGGTTDSGVSVFRLSAAGSIIGNVQNIQDTGTLNIDNPYYIEPFEIAGTRYMVIGGNGDDGFSVFRIESDGTLTALSHVRDSQNGNYLMDSNFDGAVVSTETGTYVYATGYNDDGVSVFEVTASGGLRYIDSIGDNSSTELSGAFIAEPVRIGGQDYLGVSGYIDDGITLFRIDSDGSLVHVRSIQDDSTVNLNEASGLDFMRIDGFTYLFGTGFTDNGISSFRIDMPLAASYNGVTYDTGETFAGLMRDAPGGAVISVLHSAIYSETSDTAVVDQDNIRVNFGNDTIDGAVRFDLEGFAYNFTTTGHKSVLVHGDGINSEDIRTGDGDDTIVASGGDDTVNAGKGNDLIFGGHGLDQLSGSSGSDTLDGGQGTDTLWGNGGADTLYGGRADDSLSGGGGDDALTGERGKDTLTGGNGDDLLLGENGDDVLSGGRHSDTLLGGDGNDSLNGGANADYMEGGEGADTLVGGAAADEMLGDAGGDSLSGGAGGDSMTGGAGKDILLGGDGADIMLGESGNDTMDGGSGNDTLTGGTGSDRVTGGTGSDDFVFNNGDDTLRILDFEDNVDELDLDLAGLGFASVSALVASVGTQNGADAVLDFGVDGRIIVENTTLASLINDII
ncbi:MAG: hypothetical protein N4A53_15235 [Pelagimonas sp.]|jgi:Ca2+-binding RTX toxin-like protein|nr:hypothetical protein [Pelagimonas sp.]